MVEKAYDRGYREMFLCRHLYLFEESIQGVMTFLKLADATLEPDPSRPRCATLWVPSHPGAWIGHHGYLIKEIAEILDMNQIQVCMR